MLLRKNLFKNVKIDPNWKKKVVGKYCNNTGSSTTLPHAARPNDGPYRRRTVMKFCANGDEVWYPSFGRQEKEVVSHPKHNLLAVFIAVIGKLGW